MSNPTPVLETVDLSFTHVGQSQPTIAQINLQVHPGELTVIAGATGSGKSTLLNCLTGIAPVHTGGRLSGKMLFQGEEINDWSIRQRSQQFCVLLQNVETQIFTDRVWEELVFGLENWNIDPLQIRWLVDRALQEFELGDRRYWRIAQLSAGQKQRLLLACMLTLDQPVLLLDEPFAYLDSRSVAQLVHLLRSRLQQGQAVLLIEHRLELIQEICPPSGSIRPRAYRFSEGRLSEWTLTEPFSLPLSNQRSIAAPIIQSTPSRSITTSEPHSHQKSHQIAQPPSSTFANADWLDASLLDSQRPPDALDRDSPHPRAIVLQTKNLSWGGYPAFPDLQICAGETVLLKGDNGCGKTTLLKLLSGLIKPSTGTIELLRRVVNRQRVVQIAKIAGFVLQNPNHQLFADSVRAEIWQPGVSPAIATSLLERLNLAASADQHPHALSQGQKRRLALGAVLARQPKICLLDEIMVGQDPRSLALMLAVLQDFTQQGGTLIFTSHDPIVAEVLQAQIVPIIAQGGR